jgi:diguanylate cyclase (GGDEF)-like protein
VLACVLAGVVSPAPHVAAAEHPAQAVIKRGWVQTRINPEAARSGAENALKMLESKPNVDLEIHARLLLCDYFSERDQAAAQQEIARASALLPQAQRRGLRAGVLTCEGETLEAAGNNSQAGMLYEQAVNVATDTNDEEMLAGALFQRGYLLGVQGEFASGLSDLRRAQVLYDKLNLPHHSLTTLDSIAILYNRMGDFEQAKHIYTRALRAQRGAGMLREQAVTLHNLARAHENLREWDASRQAFMESLGISRQLGYARGEAYALRGLAAVANALGDPEEALKILDRAKSLLDKTSDVRLDAQIQLASGVALHRLRRLPESIAMLESALQVFQKGNALSELVATYSELAALHAEMGDWAKAYERQTESKITSEKLLRNQINQRFATLKVEFDTSAKDKENALLIRENQANQKALAQERRARSLQRTVIGLSVLLVCLLAALAIYQHRSTRRMRTLAMTDELTSVPNRRAVLRRLDALLKRADGVPCSILIIDIDHFKSINDHYGHPTGDEVLKGVAERVRSVVREPSFFGRLGGEEFLIVLPGTNLDYARSVAETFREQIMSVDTSKWFPERRRITASIGVSTSMFTTDTTSTMLQRADTALYAAKRSGRNCVKSEPPEPETIDWLLDAQG